MNRTFYQRRGKRLFDASTAAVALLVLSPLLLLGWLAARWSTGDSGIFSQERVGRNGDLFPIRKLRTMRVDHGETTHVTTSGDVRVTRVGWFLRKTKLDELPQLWNVLTGEMSLVGPRPDMPELVLAVPEPDRSQLLTMRPGITGPASIAYRREEVLLAAVDDPERYNSEVIFPHKVAINLRYGENCSFLTDLAWLWRTAIHGSSPDPVIMPLPVEQPEHAKRNHRSAG